MRFLADVNWLYLAIPALVLGILLLMIFHRRGHAPIERADEIPERFVWSWFLVLVGTFGVLSQFFNASDVFFLVLILPALFALFARMLGYRARPPQEALGMVEAPAVQPSRIKAAQPTASRTAVAAIAPRKGKSMPVWVAFVYSNALILGVIGVLRTFVVEPMTIPSSSMRPGLIVGDFILIDKFSYGIRLPFMHTTLIPTGAPARGDVVVFRYPLDPTTNFIKRLIGVPGDTVEYRNKQLTVNGQAYQYREDGGYRYPSDQGGGMVAFSESGEREALQWLEKRSDGVENRILNDRFKPTYDPSSVSPYQAQITDAERTLVETNCQYGLQGFRCTIPPGHYFMMGDNRDNSLDSRYWGFVRDDAIAGRAFLIWLNFRDFGRIGNGIH